MHWFNILKTARRGNCKFAANKQLSVRFDHEEYSTGRISKSVSKILKTTKLCSMATINGDLSHINTAYFCHDDKFDLFFVSDAASLHVKNIDKNPSMAICIFDTRQPWDDWKMGLQLFGTASPAEEQESEEPEYVKLYEKKFPDYKEWVETADEADIPSFYVFSPTRVKIIDEEDFGEETFVEAEIIRD